MGDEEPDGDADGPGAATPRGDTSAIAEVEAAADPEADEVEEWVPLEGLSQEGLLLLFAGLAAGLASLTAYSRGQPQPVVVFGAAAAVLALAATAVDLLSGFVPGLRVHVLVGTGTSVAGAVALANRHWVNAGTFAVAAALVLYRVVDVEYRDAEHARDD